MLVLAAVWHFIAGQMINGYLTQHYSVDTHICAYVYMQVNEAARLGQWHVGAQILVVKFNVRR